MTAQAQPESEDGDCNRLSGAVPDIDEVAGHWVDAADLAHLPSLRNQFGQGHVNADLSSLAWLAAPPYTFGYHTGVLRLDGAILPAQRFRWKPWGVQREHAGPRLTVRTDARMVLQQDTLLWQVEVTNTTGEPVDCTISQDLFAMVAQHRDRMGLALRRSLDRRQLPRLHDAGANPLVRRARTGVGVPARARPAAAASRQAATARHPARRRHRADVARLRASPSRQPGHRLPAPAQRGRRPCGTSAAVTPSLTGRSWSPRPRSRLQPSSEVTLGTFELRAGQLIELELRLDAPDQAGVVFTHGNHPDSLQLGVDAGRLWFGISGEKEYANGDVAAGRWHQVTIALDDERVALSVDGDEVAVTSHWSASPRWKSLPDGALMSFADTCSAARASYAFDTVPDSLTMIGAGARAEWALRLAAHQTVSIGIVCAYGDDALATGGAAERAAADFGAALAGSEAGLP